MPRAVREGEDPFLGRVFLPEGHELGIQAEPEVPVFGILEHLPRPLTKRAEIGIGQAVTAAHEKQRAGRAESLLQGLSMGVPQDLLVGADAEDHRFGFVPIAMEMENPSVIAADHPLYPGPLSPSHGREGRRIVEQPVVVRSCEGDAKAPERLDHGSVLKSQAPDRIPKPPSVFASGGGTELPGDVLGGREELIEVVRGDLAFAPLLPPGGKRLADLDTAVDTILEKACPGGQGIAFRGAGRDSGPHDRRDMSLGDLGLQLVKQAGQDPAPEPPPAAVPLPPRCCTSRSRCGSLRRVR